jgi:hypothetical protein
MNFRRTVWLGVAALLPLLAQGQSMGSLTVKANTGRAGVFVDGKYLGPAANFKVARTYKVAAGEHELKLVEPRYEEWTTKITIQAGKKTTIAQDLKALPLTKGPFGKLRTHSDDKFAAVYVNEKYMGHAGEFDNSVQGLLLNPGDYAVRIVPTTGAPITRTVKVEANKTVIVK